MRELERRMSPARKGEDEHPPDKALRPPDIRRGGGQLREEGEPQPVVADDEGNPGC